MVETSLLLHVTTLLAASEMMAVATASDGYFNPCEELGTVETLNSLYYDVPPSGNCDDDDGKSSFHCSGIFGHGHDEWVGDGGPGAYAAIPPGKFNSHPYLIKDYTVGTDSLASAACPTEIIDNGEYPFWCPSPYAIALGGVSFTYFRRDIALPLSDYVQWEETGVSPYSNKTGRPIPLWPGPGIMLVPERGSNPLVDLPDGATPFWENRVGSSWPHDAGSAMRIDCGNGLDTSVMLLNIDERPQLHLPNDVVVQCPPRTPAWREYGSFPPGWEDYCPKLNTSDEYYEHFRDVHDKLKSLVNDGYYGPNGTFAKKFGNELAQKYGVNPEVLPGLLEENARLVLDGPIGKLMCGIGPDDFDELFIPAATYENWPDLREELFKNIENFPGNKFETVLRSWHGIGFNQLGKYMVFYAEEEEEGSEDRALAYAADFYEASQIGGGTPISIPVVCLNQTALLRDYDAKTDPKPDPFRCAKAKASASTDNGGDASAIGNGSDSKSSVAATSASAPTLLMELMLVMAMAAVPLATNYLGIF